MASALREGLIAEFGSADALRRAVAALKARGYRRVVSYTPFPVDEAERAAGLPRAVVPKLVFTGGFLGGLASYLIQAYANAWHYPLLVGGRPAHAAPAFIPATFEGTVLGAALAAFFGLLAVLRLPEPWHPVFEVEDFERAALDRFWAGVDQRDPHFDWDETRRDLLSCAPLRVERVGDER